MSNLGRVPLGRASATAYAAMALVMAVVPESCFRSFRVNAEWPAWASVFVWRVVVCVLILVLFNMAYACYRKHRGKVSIDGDNYSVQVEYGDIFEVAEGKVVVNFDECFTARIGDAPSDVKPDSVCGQYLLRNPGVDVQELIGKAGVKPEKRPRHDGRLRYKPGTIVPNGRYLLMAFAKLDSNGLGCLTFDEYVECLNTLWKQLDLHHGIEDVYVPVLGSRITRFDKDLNQQELLDIMVGSYRLSSKKMKRPAKLHIVCRECDGFSLNDVFGVS